mgnify:CR=1 FL=1
MNASHTGHSTMTIRRAADRGHTDIGWLKSWHSFSFGEYFDPANVQFKALRVINDDMVAPGRGFGMHAHRDMEIVTVVLAGELAHRDSLGHGATLRPGEVQVMSAGTGIRHSEMNPSATDPVHLIQIWIMPEQAGQAPRYDQREFPAELRRGRLCQVAAGGNDATANAMEIGQHGSIFVGSFGNGEKAAHTIAAGRAAYMHVATGSALVNGALLHAGDAATIEQASAATIEGTASGGEVIVFDLPA